MVTIKDEGDKIVCDAILHVFAKGPYNLGPVYEIREMTSANVGPGLGVIHVATAGGEDYYTEHGNDSPYSYAIVELDENQIADCDTAYAQYDNAPALPYHLNFGAYVRNVNVADPPADVQPDAPLTAEATGVYGVVVEPTLATEADNLGFNAGASVGLNGATGTQIINRIYLRQAYFLTDPNAVYTTVAYIVGV